jgi:hypothetical protein
MERRERTRVGWLGTRVAVALVLLVLPVAASAAGAGPSGTPAAAGATTSGAYGAQTWAHATAALPNGTMSVHGWFGWYVIWSATNTSATTVEFELQRTAAIALFADFCAPDCSAPVLHANLSIRGWVQSYGFVNVTSQASVTEANGSVVPAYGIANESVRAQGNLTESLRVHTTVGGVTRGASSYLAVAALAHVGIRFGTPLGVVPHNVTGGNAWSSTSPFTAAGAWSAQVLAAHASLPGAASVFRADPNGSLLGSGNLTVYGRDLGTITLHGGVTADVIALAVRGPFELHDGLLLVPGTVDLFASGVPHPWDSDGLGGASFETARDDVRVLHDGGLRFDAAASDYAGAAAAVTSAPVLGTAPATGASPSGELQAQPESTATAQHDSGCMVAACPAAGPAGFPPGFLEAIAVGALAALVVATGVLIGLRRRALRGPPGTAPARRASSEQDRGIGPRGATASRVALPSGGEEPAPPPR